MASDRRLLLALDTFDRVVPFAAETIGVWLDAAPQVDFLVTSREALRVDGEHRLPLGPLPADQGVALFHERARAAGAAPVQASWRRESVAALVEHLDGLPLAIELAAARAPLLSPDQLLERLPHWLDLLGAPRADASDRHATLRALIDASWALLEPGARAALVQCALFRGGFTADAFAAVVQPSDAAAGLALLDSLCAKSLVRIHAAPRAPHEHRFALYDTVRAYAEQHLDASGDRATVEARHARYYCGYGASWAAEVDGERGLEALDRLELEVDNLFAAASNAREADPAAAVGAAMTLEVLLRTRGPLDRLAPLLDTALALAEAIGDRRLVCDVLRAQGRLHRQRGQLDQAVSRLTAALAIAREVDDPIAAADALDWLGKTHYHAGRLGAARDAYDAARDALAGTAPGSVAARCAFGGAVVDHMRGQLSRGKQLFDESLALALAVGDVRGEGRVRASRGILYSDLGDRDGARDELEEALRIAERTGGLREQSFALFSLGDLAHDAGRHDEACEYWERSLPLWRLTGDRMGEAFVINRRARRCHELGELDRADQLYQRAIATAGRDRYESFAHGTTARRALIALERGQFARAERDLAEAVAGAQRLGDEYGAGKLAGFWAAAQALCGARDAARATLRRSLRVFDQRPDHDRHERVAVELLATLVEPEAAAAAPVGDDGAIDCWELRIARRIVARVRADESPTTEPGGTGPTPTPAAKLLLGGEARWFAIAGEPRVDLSRRAAARRVLLALSDAHRREPGRGLSVFELGDAGWPAQQLHAETVAMRVYWTIRALRGAGLGQTLLTRDDGYLLDPDLAIERLE
jgi:predicted ATPase